MGHAYVEPRPPPQAPSFLGVLEPQPEGPLGFISIFIFLLEKHQICRGLSTVVTRGAQAPGSGCVLWELAHLSAKDTIVTIRQMR